MNKNGIGPLLKGLPYWFLIPVGLLLAGSIFWLFTTIKPGSSAASTASTYKTSTPIVEITVDDQTQIIKDLIENFEVNAHTFNVYQSADKRAKFYTGTLLSEWNQYYSSLDGTNNWTIVSQTAVTNLKVVSQTDEKIIALACVSDSELEVDPKGKLLQQDPVNSFAGAYVFVKAGGTWKLAYFLNVTDTNTALAYYQKSAADLQELSGPVSDLTNIKCSQ